MDLFTKIVKDKDNFSRFYKVFSKNLKLGIYKDIQNHNKLAEFLRFYATKSTKEQVLLNYLTGKSLAAVHDSPFLEVLLLVDPIDKYTIT